MAQKQKVSFFFIIAFLFLIFGLLLIGDVSLIEAERNFGDRFYFLKRQIVWAIFGLILFFVAAKTNFHFWKKTAFLIFVFSLLPLFLVLFPSIGNEVWGARRWINLGFFNFQPSELAKFSLLLYPAAVLSEKKINFYSLLLILAPPVLLTLIEPDFGTSVIMVTTVFTVWFLSGVSFKQIVFPVLISVFLGFLAIFISPYRRQRVLGMINPFFDPQGKSYHSYQLVLTLGSGGIWGVGMGKSRQKYQYLPQVTTDSIMAVVGEEFGLLGLTFVLVAFLTMISAGFRIALRANDSFAKLFSVGLLTQIAVQGLVNLSAVAVLFPLTGIPFPLVSYGGSSLVLTLLSLGIFFNIYQESK